VRILEMPIQEVIKSLKGHFVLVSLLMHLVIQIFAIKRFELHSGKEILLTLYGHIDDIDMTHHFLKSDFG